jgi:hypothetical protein
MGENFFKPWKEPIKNHDRKGLVITPRGRFELPRRRAPMVFETIAFPD